MTASGNSKRTERRVLIIGTDGLRPDSVDLTRMPTLAKLMKQGTLFTSFHAAFPSETRVSMTTLTTGVYPGRHGVVGNLMYVPGFGNENLLQTGNDKHLMAYEPTMADSFILQPTLGDRLYLQGKRLAVAGSSSPGATLLWNLHHPERTANPASTYGKAEPEALHRQMGEVPEEQTNVRKERALWATRALIRNYLQDGQNQVMVLWLSEPDASQHDYGIGSPEHQEALQVVDACVAEVLEAMEQEGLRETIDMMWISDHGHSTIQARGSLQAHLQTAVAQLKLQTKFTAVSHYIYAVEKWDTTYAEGRALIDWLQSQEWCELVFANDPSYMDLPGVLPLDVLLGPITHQRAPFLAIQPKWNDGTNAFGVPGITEPLTSTTKLHSSHGTVSPFDMHAFCLGVGPSFKEGHVSDLACGIVDIAPTVCHLIGLREESGFDGRVLLEGLENGQEEKPFHQLEEKVTEIVSQLNDAGIKRIEVNGTFYLKGYKKDNS